MPGDCCNTQYSPATNTSVSYNCAITGSRNNGCPSFCSFDRDNSTYVALHVTQVNGCIVMHCDCCLFVPKTPLTRYSRLSNRLYNRFDNWLNVCLTTDWMFVWQPVECLYTRYTRLSNQLSNRFDNRVERTAVRSTGCQTVLYTRYSRLSNWLSNGFDNWLNVCIHDTTGCQTGLTTGCIVQMGL